MTVRGTATGPAHLSGAIFPMLTLLFIGMMIFAVVNGFSEIADHRSDCEAMGGEYVGTRGGKDMCIKDGLIIKVYGS